MTWHVDGEDLARYLQGLLPESYSCSVEAHLLACAACRAMCPDPTATPHH